MDKEAWHAAIHGVAKSRTQLSDWIELSLAPTIRTRPSFLIFLSHQESSISLLSLSIWGHTEWKPQLQKTNQTDHMEKPSISMKLWAMPCRATQDGWVMVESSHKTWSTGDGNGKPLQYSCLGNPMNSMNSSCSTTNSSPHAPQLEKTQAATAKMVLKALNNDQNGRRS